MMITAVYASLATVLLLILVLRVVLRRRQMRIGIGDGGDSVLARRIRAHGNAVETLPIALILLLLLELDDLPVTGLHGFGATLLLARALHAWGLSARSGISVGRFYGMLLTLLVMAAMAVVLLVRIALSASY